MKKLMITLFGTAILLGSSAGTIYANKPELQDAVSEVVGTPYKWGGTTTKGFDCSGFILHIFNQFEVDLPRTSKEQALMGIKVAKEDLRPGDLVFFNTDGKGISHAGIYLGGEQFAHSSSNKGVTINKISDSYYKDRYVTARRAVSGQNFLDMIDEKHGNNEINS